MCKPKAIVAVELHIFGQFLTNQGEGLSLDQSEGRISDRGNKESYRYTEVQKADRRILPLARWTYAGEFNNLRNILGIELHPNFKG